MAEIIAYARFLGCPSTQALRDGGWASVCACLTGRAADAQGWTYICLRRGEVYPVIRIDTAQEPPLVFLAAWPDRGLPLSCFEALD